jgi:hypothetical protein
MKYIKWIVFVVISILFITWIVFADPAWMNNSIPVGDLADFQKFVHLLYLILRPLLIIWWKFLSNEFVYGSSFGIDNVLWKLWQMTRVFANYMIWIILIFSIFIYFFKSDSNLSWKKILPRIVISAIVVNMSWFIIAVLIDFSSILTVAFWDIWHQMTKIITNTSNVKENDSILLPIVMDTDSTNWFIYIKEWWEKIYPCIYNLWTGNKNPVPVNVPCLDLFWWWKKIIWKDNKWNVISDSTLLSWINLVVWTNLYRTN